MCVDLIWFFSVNAERGDNVIERLLDMKRKFQRRNELTSQLRQLLKNRWYVFHRYTVNV